MGASKGTVNGIVVLFLSLICFPSLSFAVRKGQADTAIQTFNSTYWNASNKTFYKQDNKSGRLDYWMTAHAWETEMDAYERTKDPALLQKVKDTYTGFIAGNGASTNLSNNPYNDDIAWWILAATRAFDLTQDTTYRGLAKRNFDWMYSTQWDNVWGGGIWWQNRAKNQKNSCSTLPMAIAGFKLAKQLNDPAYAVKALAMQNWVRSRLYRPASGEVADRVVANGAKDSVVWGPLSYNHGVFIYGSYLAFLHTKDSAYFKEAVATSDYFRREKCDAQGIMPDEKGSGGNTSNDAGMYKTVFVHYLMRFVIEAKQKQYLPWMNLNAESLWKNRRASDNLMWFQWGTPAPTATGAEGIGSHMATGMVSLLNLIVIAEAPPPVSVRPAPLALPSLRKHGQAFSLDGKRLRAHPDPKR
jgi:predicted alpha-1,6-mannanase (GH76 family)